MTEERPDQAAAPPDTLLLHVNVDLDAATCYALIQRDRRRRGLPPAQVSFCRAADAGARRCEPHARAVDLPGPDKGRRGPDGQVHAAAVSLPEAAALAGSRLLAEVDEADSTGKVDRPRFSLQEVLAAVRQYYLATGYKDAELDYRILGTLTPVLTGLADLEEQRASARRQAAELPAFTAGGGRWAVLDGVSAGPTLGLVLNQERNCTGAVYRDGHNLGVTRYPGRAEPDLRLLADWLPGWFVHSAGFLACWGSRKSPASGPPPDGTPQSVGDLVELMQAVFGSEGPSDG